MTYPDKTMSRPRRLSLLCLIILAVTVSFFYNLDGAPLFDMDEGAFSEATREMLERGDFISTYLNGEPRYDKPILVYWCQALFVMLLGPSEAAFRLPSALAATLWVMATFLFVRGRLDEKTAFVAALMTATALWVAVIARAATADALVNLFISLSLFDIYRHFETNRAAPRNRAFLWTGLGCLTKGPVAVVIPFGVSFLLFIFRRQGRRWLRSTFHPVSLLIFLGVTLPWYAAQYAKEGQAFIEGFLLKHNVGRYLAPMEGHRGGFYYYIPAVFVMLLPYSALLARISPRVRAMTKDTLDLFLWLWFFFVLVFFSASGTKLPHYILHGCTPLLILMARYRGDLRSRVIALAPPFLVLCIVAALPEIAAALRPRIPDPNVVQALEAAEPFFGGAYRFWSILGLLVLTALPFVPKLSTWRSLLAAGLVLNFLAAHLLLPIFGSVQQAPIKEAGLLARKEGYSVVMWGIDAPSFSVYRQAVTPRRKPEQGEVVFTRANRLKDLEDYTVLYRKGPVVLARIGETDG